MTALSKNSLCSPDSRLGVLVFGRYAIRRVHPRGRAPAELGEREVTDERFVATLDRAIEIGAERGVPFTLVPAHYDPSREGASPLEVSTVFGIPMAVAQRYEPARVSLEPGSLDEAKRALAKVPKDAWADLGDRLGARSSPRSAPGSTSSAWATPARRS